MKSMKKVFALGFLFIIFSFLVSPVYVGAALDDTTTGAPPTACASLSSNGLKNVAKCLISLFNDAIYLMMALSVVYTVYGAFQMISSEEKREDGRTTIIYGIVGLFVMISIWGFVNILSSTFKLDNTPVTPPSLRVPGLGTK